MEIKEKKKKPKPIYIDKEGNIQLSLWKNKIKRGRSRGKYYAMWTISAFRFPFKFNGVINLNDSELKKLLILLGRKPSISKK